MSNKKFALIGAAGYIAPRHMAAIRDCGHSLTAAIDKNDSVGIIDSYFPDADYFTEFERFDRHVDLLRRKGMGVDYFSICSPNYLHDSHIRFALRSGGSAICEKPLVLNPWNIDGLLDVEADTGNKVNTILQLRLHDSVNELKAKVENYKNPYKYDVDLSYVTSRGKWYYTSWKGDESKSGGIATNIGVHFYDMLHYVFGNLQDNVLHYSSDSTAGGYLEYENARVRWMLSIDENMLPGDVREKGGRTHRAIKIGQEEFEFSGGFTDLHTKSYRAILAGNGFGLEENRVAIETVSTIRNLDPRPGHDSVHPTIRDLLKNKFI